MPELVKIMVEKKVGEYCKNKVPAHALHQVNISYKTRGNRITIYENRAPWRPEFKEWTSMPIALIKPANGLSIAPTETIDGINT